MPHTKGIELLRQQITEANGGEPEDFAGWKQRTATAIRLALGENHPANGEFTGVRYGLTAWTSATPQSAWDRARKSGVKAGTAILQAGVFELETLRDATAGSGARPRPDATESGPVFIVHGHDSGVQNEVAHTVQVLTGTQPIVLHEQPDGGRTIIEKFEAHAAEASFAVAILTGDDVGRAVSDPHDRPRARQNVIFEAGYFVGRLGRDRVVLLYEPGVEWPSDLLGVAYEELDVSGRWKYELGKELRHAGIDADLNKL